ncbi:hypothetical protein CAOG_05923 [Capsaspora owczarzaki ATCC 30864]|uniref:Uncharacterized protein n=1 Tax=Capsaspora owczarzaki (strain ATCC 30864) TaxID=595528 RepID=A0A0D2X456_CAPO3|nr:hypothetical protein CAOG_05923 [Capsaspora owczarzaki ATCC 30864]KJE95474.1 hypothetical protein CAOG_005923 [Capsaspora owczarzaki ATCC 30864]|eukprot:XP_004345513.2 hypothetical protein CAOG_05923 [Capsaspora owczarzaki ATCC 30864]
MNHWARQSGPGVAGNDATQPIADDLISDDALKRGANIFLRPEELKIVNFVVRDASTLARPDVVELFTRISQVPQHLHRTTFEKLLRSLPLTLSSSCHSKELANLNPNVTPVDLARTRKRRHAGDSDDDDTSAFEEALIGGSDTNVTFSLRPEILEQSVAISRTNTLGVSSRLTSGVVAMQLVPNDENGNSTPKADRRKRHPLTDCSNSN